MKRILFFISIFCFTTYQQVYAQWNDALVDNTQTAKYAVGIYGNADFGSNAVTTNFAYNFLQGNYIDNNLKQEVASHLRQQNQLGYNLNYGIYGVLYHDTIKGKRVFNFFVAVRHKKYINTSFTADDFNIPFYGNASYAGKSAQLSPFSFNNLSYQQAELGLVCTNFGGGAQFGAGLSFLAGQQFTSINASNATLYTDTYGEYLTLNSNAQIQQSDTSSGYQKRVNGYGASLDIYFRAPYKIGRKKGNISVSVSDIGFLWWNKNSLTYQKDTSFTYNGITINSIADLQNATFNTLTKDSLQKKYFPFTKQAFYAPIPTTLKINTNTAITETFHLEIGYWNVFNANDIGYIYAQEDKYLTHGWVLALQAGYGDYTGINIAVNVAKEFKNAKIELAINHLQGIIMPDRFGGAGAYLGYTYLFGK